MTVSTVFFPPRRIYNLPLTAGRVLDLGERPIVMGILNVTPDSFADASHPRDAAEALELGLRMEADGADIIDVGGESTRPGADSVPADEERRRVLPVVRALAARVRIPISIDTYKATVAEAAIGEGASMVNDVSGLRYEPGLAEVVARTGAALVLMHNRGRSKTMYQQADYRDVVSEAIDELAGSVRAAAAAGVRLESIVIDPGIGFAKRAADSYGVLARLPEFATGLDRPLLAGPSRKSFMRDALGDRPAAERDWGTAAAVAAAVLAGAHIVRVHAVSAMAQVVRVAEAIRQGNRGVGDRVIG
jgi:dihydropteroate synthase